MMYNRDMLARELTKKIKIHDVSIGGENKVLIQSMCNIKTEKVDEVVNQIHALEKEGCDIIRVSVLDDNDAYAIKDIVSKINIPLIADIHFSSRLAKLSILNGASKIRLNPGNLKDENEIVEIIDLCKKHIEAGKPIKEVYELGGFGGYNHFFRAFKKEYGMTPKEYYESLTE